MVYIAFVLSKAEQTKQFIIEKSAPIFNKKGYAATSLNDILSATGLAKGGVYGHFSSKDEIALQVFDFAQQQLLDAISVRIKMAKSALDKLFAIVNFYYNYSINPILEGGCPLLNTAIDSDYNFPALKKKAAEASKQMLEALVRIVAKGKENGEFSNNLDVEAEARLIFSVIEGGMMMSRLQEDPKHLNQLLDYLKQHIQQY
jgi:TetR/AcrR family transcriptional repressor of nem operon